MSESRILIIDGDAARAERLCGLLEFMDLTPRWVESLADLDLGRHHPHDWFALVVGDVDQSAAATEFFARFAATRLPPPVLLLEGESAAFADAYGLH
jgi:sigma-54 specific flagellar transcriptional regulator A